MKIPNFLFIVALFFTSCDKRTIETEILLPVCVMEMTSDPDQAPRTIWANSIGTTNFFWLSTGVGALDGAEFVVNNNCDTICINTGWAPTCLNVPFEEEWTVIWSNPE